MKPCDFWVRFGFLPGVAVASGIVLAVAAGCSSDSGSVGSSVSRTAPNAAPPPPPPPSAAVPIAAEPAEEPEPVVPSGPPEDVAQWQPEDFALAIESRNRLFLDAVAHWGRREPGSDDDARQLSEVFVAIGQLPDDPGLNRKVLEPEERGKSDD